MKFKSFTNNPIRLVLFPIVLILFLVEANLINRKTYSNDELKPAEEKDLYLYKGMGASYLCIASKAGIEFPKAVGIATATYVQVLEGKHGGLIEELGDTKLQREKLFAGAEFQIVTTAIRYCPDSIPKDVTKKVNKILKDNSKKK
tara:strand:- start:2825 stop:3259 length:435 start_codon:yes stop_codon:yes gene_type:complete